MNKFLTTIFCIIFFNQYFLTTEQAKAIIPYYYLPSIKNLEKESLLIGTNAYQLLYFGQIEKSLNLAKLAVKINNSNDKLWLILSEAQIANEFYREALVSLKKAEGINNQASEIYFAQSTVYLKLSKLNEARIALESGLKINPNNQNAIFQLGNIFLMKKDYKSAIKKFNEAIKIKPDFWQAINNLGLAYFEQNKIKRSISFFKKAISINENSEPLLGLASCLRINDIDSALKLAKKALKKNPNYVNYDFRKEQLWGEKIQISIEELLKNDQLKKEVIEAESKIN